ncbi:hypothetical protein DACRYDRAFT_25218 [Dacryopinax primogenitus]|uniref:Uncharacterized protein n=1 Tax=Dacryopinax primogenitus (strain DJM 731) TaxID=1858805 RepID=M5FZZ3_DACPD|nr:uncharacterized protein DACRYDRAFT_25218 [Dacryopinax primogenitus]EJT97087.1 hypothetical protein DACRYDRAFT_25218 [Dacryopinax primogenitus]
MVADVPSFKQKLLDFAIGVNKPSFQARPEFLKQYWEHQLLPEQRQEYVERALKERGTPDVLIEGKQTSGCPSEKIFATIAAFHKAVSARTGWVLFTLAGGVDKSGARAVTHVDSGKTSANLGFSEYNVRHHDGMMQAWKDFVKATIPAESRSQQAPMRILPTLQRDTCNRPILPPLDSAWNQLEIAVMLQTYLMSLYEHETSNSLLDWASVSVQPGRLPIDVSLSDPEHMSFMDMLKTYTLVREQQEEFQEEFTFFTPPDQVEPFHFDMTNLGLSPAPANQPPTTPAGRQPIIRTTQTSVASRRTSIR